MMKKMRSQMICKILKKVFVLMFLCFVFIMNIDAANWQDGVSGKIFYNGYVGIFTSYPTMALSVWDNIAKGRIAGFYGGVVQNAGDEALIHIGGANGPNHYGIEVGTTATKSVPNNPKHAFIVKTNDSEGTDHKERFRITAEGDVGIGTSFPQTKLMVLANISKGRIAGFYGNMVQNAGDEALVHIGGANGYNHYGIEIGATPQYSVPSYQKHAFIVKTNTGDGTGHIERFRITADGNIGIGTSSPGYKLTVNGGIFAQDLTVNSGMSVNGEIHAKKIRVDTIGFPDYVFNNDYKLMSLAAVEKSIKQNKHLPGVPSAEEAKKNGVDIGEMQKILLEKVEELTLHMIEQNKKTENISTDLANVKKENEMLKNKLKEAGLLN